MDLVEDHPDNTDALRRTSMDGTRARGYNPSPPVGFGPMSRAGAQRNVTRHKLCAHVDFTPHPFACEQLQEANVLQFQAYVNLYRGAPTMPVNV